MHGSRVGVIYPYSTGLRLGRLARKAGMRTVGVFPADPEEHGMTRLEIDDADWDERLRFRGTAHDLATLIGGQVDYLLAGDEAAVPLTEATAGILGLPGNDPATTAARTDKAAMHAALAVAGLAGPVTAKATSEDAAQAAAERIGWPVTVKPTWSASSVGVSVARTPREMTAAWQRATGAPGALGRTCTDAIIQEYMTGPKWTVNTVTVEAGGRLVHTVTDVWRDEMAVTPSGGFAYRLSELLTTGRTAQADLVAGYARRCLAAAGVRFGPANVEIILTSAGPKMIELAARMSGTYPQFLAEAVTGQSQPTAAIAALTDPAELAARPFPAGDGRGVLQAWLVPPRPCTVDVGVLREIFALPGAESASPGLAAAGAAGRDFPAPAATDTPTCLGYVNFCAPRRTAARSWSKMLALENGLYR
jgi:biotin carboxylase